jgi:phospholipid/cholesterol/gamma-HCH transport system ATP-binding protein
MSASDNTAAIRTEGLVCGYGEDVILRDVNVSIPKSRITCVLGGSGCGKSTLLRTLLGLEAPLAGSIEFSGKKLAQSTETELAALRRRVGVLFQGAALFNSLTLWENVAFPLLELTGTDEDLARETARMKLSLVGLGAFLEHLPSEVSGGMRKRCGIARALVRDPEVLFLDEPGAGLDPVTSAALDHMILDIKERLGTTVVVVTHELLSIRALADHAIMLGGGGVLAQGALSVVEASNAAGVHAFFSRQAHAEPERGGGLAELLCNE